MTRIRPAEFEINSGAQLAQGLVFAGLGRHTGSTHFHDSSLYKHYGTLTNMDPPTDWVWVPELGRWATDYDGVDDIVEITGGPTIVGDISAAAWVKTTSTVQSAIFDHWQAFGSYPGYVWRQNYPVAGKQGWYSGGSGWRAANTANDDGTWHHLGFVGQGATWQFYLDGAADGNGTPWDNAESYVGTGIIARYGASDELAAVIADLCLWTRALSVAEIARLADPSNVMLDGLIQYPRRRVFPSAAAPPAGLSIPIAMHHYQQMTGA